MSVETLRPSDSRLAGAPFTSAMPLRILNKGPDYFRRVPEPSVRKLSAVERLEADKAKYVKSQRVVHTKQEPIKPPIIRKPLMSPGMMLHTPPARKVPRWPSDSENGAQGPCRATILNLEILNNLINISDGPQPSPQSPSSLAPSASSEKSVEPQPAFGFRATSSSCTLKSHTQPSSHSSPAPEPSHRPPPVPARVSRPPAPVSASNPNPVAVRRVDVLPQAEMRKPQRMPIKVYPKPLQSQLKSRQTAHPQVPSLHPPSFQSLPSASQSPSSSHPPSSPLITRAVLLPPSSPACTRLSSASSRGSTRRRPALHRSKSDLSDRYARANADLERFFNYCGLEPNEVEGMEHFGRANSDIISISKLRSVSTPSSECGDDRRTRYQEEDDDDDDDARPSERAPYGISIIERNARVIKWLYGIRQARDTQTAPNL